MINEMKEYLEIKNKREYLNKIPTKIFLELIDLFYFIDPENKEFIQTTTAQISNRNKMFIYSLTEQETLNLTPAEREKGFNLIDLMTTGRFLKKEFLLNEQDRNNFGKKINYLKKIISSNEYVKYLEDNLLNIENNVIKPEFSQLANTDSREVFEILFDVIVSLSKNNIKNLTKENYENSYLNKKIGLNCFSEEKKISLSSIFCGFIDEFSNNYFPIFNHKINNLENGKYQLQKIILDYFNNRNQQSLLENLKILTKNNLVNGVQTIDSNGEKKVNGEQKGNVIPIMLNNNSSKIYLCEGVATGISISKMLSTQENIISCVNVKNLEYVAKEYLKQQKEVILCIDIDKPIFKSNKIFPGAGAQMCYNINKWIKEAENTFSINKLAIITPLPSEEIFLKLDLKDVPFRDDGLGITTSGELFRIKDFTGGKLSDFNDLERYSNVSENGWKIKEEISKELQQPLFYNKEQIQENLLKKQLDEKIFDLKVYGFLTKDNMDYETTKKLPLINWNGNELDLKDDDLKKIIKVYMNNGNIENDLLKTLISLNLKENNILEDVANKIKEEITKIKQLDIKVIKNKLEKEYRVL